MRHLLPIVLSLGASAAHADGSCGKVLGAMTRGLDTPSHVVTGTTIGAMTTEKGEMINTGSQRY